MNVQQDWQEIDPAGVALAGAGVPWVVAARQSAFERFKAQGLPNRRDEAWKYTDVSMLARRASLLPDNIPPDAPSEAALQAWALSRENVHLMVFVNGHYSPELSFLRNPGPDTRIESLADLLDNAAELPAALFVQAREASVFDALNLAFSTDGAVLRLAPGARPEMPIYLLFIASGHGPSIYPRNLVIAGEGSRATVIEHYIGMMDTHNFTNARTRIELAAGAEIEHCKLQQEGAKAYHLAGIHADCAADSRFISHSFALGGKLARNDITVRLNQPGAACTLDGLYLLERRQQADHHILVEHLAPGCTSRQHYRGVLDDDARGVFSGKIVVHPDAVKTDAHQTNHNLLLSKSAEVDTRPALEIFADDVRCTHGATVGQLDEDSLFYLRSRGLDAETARGLLIYGFANDIIERIALPELRQKMVDLVLDRLSQGESIKELL